MFKPSRLILSVRILFCFRIGSASVLHSRKQRFFILRNAEVLFCSLVSFERRYYYYRMDYIRH